MNNKKTLLFIYFFLVLFKTTNAYNYFDTELFYGIRNDSIYNLKSENLAIDVSNIKYGNITIDSLTDENICLKFIAIERIGIYIYDKKKVAPLLLKLSILKSLTHLKLKYMFKCDSIPVQIGLLKKLEWLDISENGIKTIPISICNLSNLQVLIISYSEKCTTPYLKNSISKLPLCFSNLTALKKLYIEDIFLSTEDSFLLNLRNLEVLMVGGLDLESSKYINHLSNLRLLALKKCDNCSTLDYKNLKSLEILYIPVDKTNRKSIHKLTKRLKDLQVYNTN